MRTRFLLAASLLALILQIAPSFAQTRIPAPAEARSFSALTSYAELQAFLGQMDSLPSMQVAPLATSREGRTVSLVRWPEDPARSDTARITVMLFAQQHGDEPSGKEAMTLLLSRLSAGGKPEWRDHLSLLVIPQMNPDGAEAGRRRTSDTLDMNRSHVLLHTPEVRALHDLYLAAWPEVTLDVHEYGSFTSSWSDSGFIKTGDVQIGTLTNLNSGAALRSYQKTRMFPYLSAAVMAQQYSCHEYIVGDPGTLIRHSTTEINDGRQSFGIRGSISFIQEGRKWRDLSDQLERRARSQYAGIEALLDFCAANWREVRKVARDERARLETIAGTTLYTCMDHVTGPRTMSIPVMDVATSTPRSWTVTPYHSDVRACDSVRLPRAYLVPGALTHVHELLAMHKVMGIPAGRDPIVVEEYRISGIDSLGLEGEAFGIPRVKAVVVTLTPDPGAMIYSLNQDAGLFLGSVLEPRSVWGLSKYSRFEDLFRGPVYPVGRVVPSSDGTAIPPPERRGGF
jgi:hypothetical protein